MIALFNDQGNNDHRSILGKRTLCPSLGCLVDHMDVSVIIFLLNSFVCIDHHAKATLIWRRSDTSPPEPGKKSLLQDTLVGEAKATVQLNFRIQSPSSTKKQPFKLRCKNAP